MMADNPQKRALINRAILIFSGGTTSAARLFYTDIDDNYYSDPFTNVPSTRKDILAACVTYEQVLQRVLTDLKPDFAKRFADLGAEVKVNKEYGDYPLLFELPDDYLDLIDQLNQDDNEDRREVDILTFKDYAHVVVGTDGQAYSCSSAHTSAAATKPITGASYATNWELYDEDGRLGANWVTDFSYKSSQTGKLLGAYSYSNNPSTTVDSGINSAYIEYLAYVQAGFADEPQYYDEAFKNAFCTRYGAELALAIGKDYTRRRQLLEEYKKLAGGDFLAVEAERKHIPERVSIVTNSKNLVLPK